MKNMKVKFYIVEEKGGASAFRDLQDAYRYVRQSKEKLYIEEIEVDIDEYRKKRDNKDYKPNTLTVKIDSSVDEMLEKISELRNILKQYYMQENNLKIGDMTEAEINKMVDFIEAKLYEYHQVLLERYGI